MTKHYTIDASGRSLGRVASETAAMLRGKGTTTFDPARLPDVKVTVTNAGKVRFTGKKMEQKKYYNFSGYPGGLKATSLRDKFEKSPESVMQIAVRNMLPPNKLRARLMKRLTVTA